MEGQTGGIGSLCEFLNNCLPGGSCQGVSDTEARCLQICDASDSTKGDVDAGIDAGIDLDAGLDTGIDLDAGTDAGTDSGPADAGVDSGPGFTGECPEALTCIPREPGEGGMVRTPTPPGLCATPE